MFLFKKKQIKIKYDPSLRKPMIRSSICTGEKVAGFRNLSNGHFEEVSLIRNEKDLREFKEKYGIQEEIETFY